KREQRIKEREDSAIEQAQLRIANIKVRFDTRSQNGEDVPIQQRHGVGEGHQRQRIPGGAGHPARHRHSRHSLNTRSALVCMSFFFASAEISRLSCTRTSSATYSYG